MNQDAIDAKLRGLARRKDRLAAIKAAYSLGYSDGHEFQMKMRVLDAKEHNERFACRLKPPSDRP